MIKEYRTLCSIENSMVYANGLHDVSLGEYAELLLADGRCYPLRVVAIENGKVALRAMSDLRGVDLTLCKLRFTSKEPSVSLSPDLLGRHIDGQGKVIDGFADIIPDKRLPIYADPIPPHLRKSPACQLKTGNDQIDSMALSLGQIISIYSAPDLSPLDLAYDIAVNLKICDGKSDSENIALVLGATETPQKEIERLHDFIMPCGRGDKSVVVSSKIQDTVEKKLSVPYTAMTVAEYFAFERGFDVILVFSDVSRYSKLEGYDYSGWIKLLDRVGVRKDKPGSITLISVFTSQEYKNNVSAEAMAYSISDRCFHLTNDKNSDKYSIKICK